MVMNDMDEVRIHHILKDGTKVDDISGHVLKSAEHPTLYEIIDRIAARKKEEHEWINS